MSETEEESDYGEEEVEEEEDFLRPSSPDDPYVRGYRDGFLNASSRFNSDEDADSDDEDLDQYRQHSDFWKGFRAAIRGYASESEEETDYEEEDVEEDEDEDYEERTSHSWKMSTRCKRFCAIFF